MTLLEMKKKVLRLIEEVSDDKNELTDDPDIKAKLNDVINQIMFEVARIKKIAAREIVKITADTLELRLKELDGFYQLDNVKFVNEEGIEAGFDIFGDIIEFAVPGEARIYYFKYPERITDDTTDTAYEFELSDDALEIMPYGVAGDILKSDISNQYGKIYSQRYEEMLQRLDPRYSMVNIYIEGGLDI